MSVDHRNARSGAAGSGAAGLPDLREGGGEVRGCEGEARGGNGEARGGGGDVEGT